MPEPNPNHMVARDEAINTLAPHDALILIEHVLPGDTWSLNVEHTHSGVTFLRYFVQNTHTVVQFTATKDSPFYELVQTRWGLESDTLEGHFQGLDVKTFSLKNPQKRPPKNIAHLPAQKQKPQEPNDKLLKQDITDILALQVTEPSI